MIRFLLKARFALVVAVALTPICAQTNCIDVVQKIDQYQALRDAKVYEGRPVYHGPKPPLQSAEGVPADVNSAFQHALAEPGQNGAVWWGWSDHCGCWYRYATDNQKHLHWDGMTRPTRPGISAPKKATVYHETEVSSYAWQRAQLDAEIRQLKAAVPQQVQTVGVSADVARAQVASATGGQVHVVRGNEIVTGKGVVTINGEFIIIDTGTPRGQVRVPLREAREIHPVIHSAPVKLEKTSGGYAQVDRLLQKYSAEDLARVDEAAFNDEIYRVKPKEQRAASEKFLKEQHYKSEGGSLYSRRYSNGEEIVSSLSERPDAWWMQQQYRDMQSTASYKVYLGIPPDELTNALPEFLNLAKGNGAYGAKWGASATDYARPDRFVVYFDNPKLAVAFAKKADNALKRFHGRHEIDMTYNLGERVSIGYDNMTKGKEVSQRGATSNATVSAAKKCSVDPKNCLRIICKEFKAVGIDADTFLEASLAQALNVNLRECP